MDNNPIVRLNLRIRPVEGRVTARRPSASDKAWEKSTEQRSKEHFPLHCCSLKVV
ncbi:hypothetical protein [Mycetocola sp. 2940]|uniref:hypothetical protein n=1 Tax=Mycetocola sp. 2940 TaxID=3156452 RepID=UPI003397E5BF